MDVFLGRKSINRTDSDGLLTKPMVNPRFSHSKRWNEVVKGENAKKTDTVEPIFLNADEVKIAESAVVKELETKLGFYLPKGNIEKVSEVLKQKLSHQVNCTVFELQEFCNKIQMVLEKVSNFGNSEWKVMLAGIEFVFNVDNCVVSRAEIKGIEYGNRGKSEVRLPVSRIKMCRDYEDKMIEAFLAMDEELINHQEFKRLTEKSVHMIQKDVKQAKKLKEEIAKAKNDLEWQKEELKFYRSDAITRRDSKLTKESVLESEILNLREKRVSIAQGFEDLENEQKKLSTQKSVLSKILINLQQFCDNFGKYEVSKESPTKLRNEIIELEVKLKELEEESRRNFAEENLRLQINRLKTKISSLRSISAISNTITATSSAKSKMNNFNNLYAMTRLPAKPVTIKSFCSPLASSSATKFNLTKPILNSHKSDRSLSVSQKLSLDSKLEDKKINIENGVSQQQGKLIKKQYMTPDNDFKILKGDTKRIVQNIEHKRNLTEEVFFDTAEDLNENKIDEQEKLAEEKWKFFEKIEEFKEMLASSLSEIIGR